MLHPTIFWMIGYRVFGWFYLGDTFLVLLVIDEAISIRVHSVHRSLIENVFANSRAKAKPYCFSFLACVCGLEFRSWIGICMSDMGIFVCPKKWKKWRMASFDRSICENVENSRTFCSCNSLLIAIKQIQKEVGANFCCHIEEDLTGYCRHERLLE